jgi:hypothetical protein
MKTEKTKEYKEMIKVNKKLNTLRYVFYAMIYDLDKMKTPEFPKNQSEDFKKLRSRVTTLFNTDMKNTYKEYEQLVNLVYKPI